MARRALLCAVLVAVCDVAHATYSIAACDRTTGACGVAVATHNLAVGSSVPFARALVGAGVSQFETNPLHAEAALAALERGDAADVALRSALTVGEAFDDGLGLAFRQVGLVRFAGGAAAHTGGEANSWAGHRTGVSESLVSVQGNGLVSEDVIDALWTTFASERGTLADRLLAALEAGHAAGGQTIGVTSAALRVATPDGWPVDLDLRVDYEQGRAVEELRRMYDAHRARVLLFRARRAESSEGRSAALRMLREAHELAPDWDRIWLQSARLAESWQEKELARDCYCRFQELNEVWAASLEIGEDLADCSGN